MDYKEYGDFDSVTKEEPLLIDEGQTQPKASEPGLKKPKGKKAKKGEKDQERSRKILAWVLCVMLILVILIILFSRIIKPTDDNKKITDALNMPQEAVGAVITPVETAFSSVTSQVVNYLRGVKLRSNIEMSYNELRAEVDRLVYENLDLKAQIEDLQPYKELSGEYSANIAMNPTVAKVINQESANSYFSSFTINKGSNHGIEPYMAVVFDGGLVGYTESVTATQSTVRAVIDSNFSIAALIESSRLQGSVKGTLGIDGEAMCRMYSLSGEALPRPGDMVISSGIGISFPKGIPIGIVRESTRGLEDNRQYIVIEPVVDLKSLEHVVVLRYKPEAGAIALQGVDDSDIVIQPLATPFPYLAEGVGEEDPDASPSPEVSPTPTPTPTPGPTQEGELGDFATTPPPNLEYIVPNEGGAQSTAEKEAEAETTQQPSPAPEATIALDDLTLEDD